MEAHSDLITPHPISIPRRWMNETSAPHPMRFQESSSGYPPLMTDISSKTSQTPDRGSESNANYTSIRVYPDGPLLVRGAFSITDEHGREIEIKRRAVSLCRCGRTGLAPLCDGSHARRGTAKPTQRSDA